MQTIQRGLLRMKSILVFRWKHTLIGMSVDNQVEYKKSLRMSKLTTIPFGIGRQNGIFTIWNIQRASKSKQSMPSADEEFRHLDYGQLNEMKTKENNFVIDVREKSELEETGVIPGAYHIPLGELGKALEFSPEDFQKAYNFTKPLKEHEIIFSCRSGKRSLVALEKALASGFINAKHYKGGWLDWEKQLAGSK